MEELNQTKSSSMKFANEFKYLSFRTFFEAWSFKKNSKLKYWNSLSVKKKTYKQFPKKKLTTIYQTDKLFHYFTFNKTY